MTEDLIALFNERFGRDLTPVFNQYLRQADLPKLELASDGEQMRYRWQAGEPGFNLPIRVGAKETEVTIEPVAGAWKTMPRRPIADFEAATTLYYFEMSEPFAN
jgi:aminopeptidase N